MAPLNRDNKSMNAKHAAILKEMLKRPDNKVCGDCKRNDARWASTNIGVFMCIRCSGIHRGMGVHISRVKSVDLDTWTPEQIATIQRWGNKRANIYWEAHLKKGHQPPEHKMESFIRSKYESKRWAMDGPVPDPDSLDPDSAVTLPADETSAATTSVAPAKSAGKASNSLDLLSGIPPPAEAAPPVRTGQSGTGNGLFDLDFSGAATSGASAVSSAAPRNNKADILSLFGQAPVRPFHQQMQATTPATTHAAPPVSQTSPQNPLAGQFAGMNLGGAASVNPWNASAPSTHVPAAQPSLFDSHDVWGASPSTTSGTGAFDGFGDTVTQSRPKQPDAFSNIWD